MQDKILFSGEETMHFPHATTTTINNTKSLLPMPQPWSAIMLLVYPYRTNSYFPIICIYLTLVLYIRTHTPWIQNSFSPFIQTQSKSSKGLNIKKAYSGSLTRNDSSILCMYPSIYVPNHVHKDKTWFFFRDL